MLASLPSSAHITLKAKIFKYEKDVGRLRRTQPVQRTRGELMWNGSYVTDLPLPDLFLFEMGNSRMPLGREAGTPYSLSFWTPVGKAGSAGAWKY